MIARRTSYSGGGGRGAIDKVSETLRRRRLVVHGVASCVCEFVCLYVFICRHAVKGKLLELSTPVGKDMLSDLLTIACMRPIRRQQDVISVDAHDVRGTLTEVCVCRCEWRASCRVGMLSMNHSSIARFAIAQLGVGFHSDDVGGSP